jgi:TRAP-type C4-dicarboxylate transport system permease small subunit
MSASLNAAAPAPLRLLLDAIEKLARLDGWIGAGCLVALTALMLAEITVRALSNVFPSVPADIPVAWEYSSYLMAACFTFGAAMTLRAGGHIRVTLVLARVQPGPRRLLEVFASLAAMVFTGFLALAMVRFTLSAYERGQTSISSDTLLWIPQSLVAFGMVLLTLQFLARTIQAAYGLPLEDARMRAGAPVE